MSQNLKPFILEEVSYTAAQVLEHLADQVPGRSIGERFVVNAAINDSQELELELDDGCRFAFQCRRLT